MAGDRLTVCVSREHQLKFLVYRLEAILNTQRKVYIVLNKML